jgi:dephospho-CoA kinase
MTVLAIVGMPGCGKTIVASHLKSKGFPVLSFGSIILDEVTRRGLPMTPDNERVVREDLRRRYGMDVCAVRTLPQIRDELTSTSLVVIDGLYSWSEYKTLRKEFGDSLIVLGVYAPRALRYSRLASRSYRPLTAIEAELRDIREIEALEKGGPIAMADLMIVNDGTEDELCERIENVMSSMTERDP